MIDSPAADSEPGPVPETEQATGPETAVAPVPETGSATRVATGTPLVRSRGVLQAVAVLAMIALPAVVVVLLASWDDEIPDLVACEGTVRYKGKLLTKGYVQTMLHGADQSDTGSIGPIDEHGRFELMTNGKPGAPVGHHRVAVMVFSEGQVPQPLVPSVYTDLKTTPLAIDIQPEKRLNLFSLIVTDRTQRKR